MSRHTAETIFYEPLCVCVRVRVCVCTSVHREGFICLDHLDFQGTDQQCFVEDVHFLRQVTSLLL